MISRWLFPIILMAAVPALGDDLVTTNQVVAGEAAGALPVPALGNNTSLISQSGYGNMATADQFGSGDFAEINQDGNNFRASILQTSQQDSAVVNQTGNGAGSQPLTITQFGPAQSITITVHR